MKDCRRIIPWNALLSLLLAFSLILPLTACGRSGKETKAQAFGRMIPLVNVQNARELGGYAAGDGRTVKYGVLLRTAKLTSATAEDIRTLTEDYHLAVVIDLRMDYEVQNAPDPQIEGVKYRNITIMDKNAPSLVEYGNLENELYGQGVPIDAATDLRIGVKSGFYSNQMYVDFLSSDVGKAGYSEFFKELLALPADSAILFHCSVGKDRTGCAAMLILTALGVDEETIMQDYLLTNEVNAGMIAEERAYLRSCGVEGEELELCMIGMHQVNIEQMNNALTWLKENYGSPLGYITEELGVTEEEIGILKDKFLE